MKHREKFVQIINHYGEVNQKLKAQEEMRELAAEIYKDVVLDEIDLPHLKEELADVYNTLAQIEIMYGLIREEIEDLQELKIERTLRRIAKS